MKKTTDPLATPMVEQRSARVKRLIRELHQNYHIDAMTKKWLKQQTHHISQNSTPQKDS